MDFLRFSQQREEDGKFRGRQKVLEAVKKLNIPVIDLYKEVFSKISDPFTLFPFRENRHFTAEGYNLIANEVIKKAEKNNKSN